MGEPEGPGLGVGVAGGWIKEDLSAFMAGLLSRKKPSRSSILAIEKA
jgi:hypothetical protein